MSDLETKAVSLLIDETLDGEVEKLRAEGWQQIPGTVAIAVYYLVRPKVSQQPVVAGFFEGTMQIDDDKVFVRDKDGNIRKN